MKTYAEKCGKKPFDWFAELHKRAVAQSPPVQRLTNLAREWPTCACGNQCAKIPRWETGIPRDEALFNLGCSFVMYVSVGDWDNALMALIDIERRSIAILKSMRAAPKKKPATRRRKK